MSMFDVLGIKHIHNNPYFPQGNRRIENVHIFPMYTIAKVYLWYSTQMG